MWNNKIARSEMKIVMKSTTTAAAAKKEKLFEWSSYFGINT